VTDDLEQTTISPRETDGPAADAAPPSAYEPAAASEYEPAADAAPATTVLAPGATASGNRRWAIAAGVVGVLVVASALAFSLFTGRAANATVLGYVPTDSIMYGEFRMDLPGDQRQAVGSFLSKFPGFADQTTVETKIDEILDRLVGGATDGEQAYSSDIKPWFGGEVAFSVGALPDPATLESPDASMNDARFLALLSVKDEAAATAWLDGVIDKGGASRSSEAYGGTTVHTFSASGEPNGAYAIVDGKVAIVGDPLSVKASIDTKGASAFGSGAEFEAALDATTGDHIGFMYIALRPLIEWSAGLGEQTVPGLDGSALTGLIPDWAAFALRVEGDALRMETLSPKPEGDTAAARTSTVAEHVPSSAIALSVSNDYGKGILSTIDTYRAEPSAKEFIDGLDQAIGVLGGSDAAIGWIGDLGIAVTRTENGVEGGFVITPTDRAAADRLFTSLRTLISLGGGGMGITVRDEAYAGTTITVVDLGDLSDLAGLAGMAGVSPDMLGSDLPVGRVELAYAITDGVVVIGSGPGFVRSVLDTTPETSLARNDPYEALISKVSQGTGSGFVDITAIRELIEGAMANADAAERAEYETNIQPFLTPIDALVGSSSIAGDVSRSTLIVTVK
jgi:hypothetical protein